MKSGKFVVSLDLELFWGVRDKRTIDNYGDNIRNEHQVVSKILDLFNKYNISATWAVVGFLFCRDRSEIMKFAPAVKPNYLNKRLDPYESLRFIGEDVATDPYHYGWDLISQIKQYKSQEIATHTFSHYYCLEPNQDLQSFRADIRAAVEVAQYNDLAIKSIVFPRNQYTQEFLSICFEFGIYVFRGTECHWAYSTHPDSRNSRFKRVYRLVDSYINCSGDHVYVAPDANSGNKINIPASRFLRPYSTGLKWLEPLKIARIRKSMLMAARSGKVYHMWWHPHNFGKNIAQNLEQLEEILTYYGELNKIYGMQSQNMGDFLIER